MVSDTQTSRRQQIRWTAEELKRLETLAEEKNRQKRARRQDPSAKVPVSWREIGEMLGGRDAAATQARYNALVKQNQIDRLQSIEPTSPPPPRGTPLEPIEVDDNEDSRSPSTPGVGAVWFREGPASHTTDRNGVNIRNISELVSSIEAQQAENDFESRLDPRLMDKASKGNKTTEPQKRAKSCIVTLPLQKPQGSPSRSGADRAARVRGAEKTTQQIAQAMALEKELRENMKNASSRSATDHVPEASSHQNTPDLQTTVEDATDEESPRRKRQREGQTQAKTAPGTAKPDEAVAPRTDTLRETSKSAKTSVTLDELKRQRQQRKDEEEAQRKADDAQQQKDRELEQKIQALKESKERNTSQAADDSEARSKSAATLEELRQRRQKRIEEQEAEARALAAQEQADRELEERLEIMRDMKAMKRKADDSEKAKAQSREKRQKMLEELAQLESEI